MYPATAVPAHSLNALDRMAFYKSVREKRKQLQLNHQNNAGKDTRDSATENTFLTQMLQSSSPSIPVSSSNSSSLSIASILRKSDLPSSSHRTVTSTLTNILPALLNGTLPSPRASSPSDPSNLTSPRGADVRANQETKCSTSLPVSPKALTEKKSPLPLSSPEHTSVPTSSSPPARCRSNPMTSSSSRFTPPTSAISPTSPVVSSASSCPSLATGMTKTTLTSSTSPSPEQEIPIKIVRSASVKSCASDSGVSSSSPLSDNNIVHVFRTNHSESTNPLPNTAGSRKRKSLAHFYDELNKDKKFSTEATVSSAFPTANTPTSNANIPYNQSEAIALGYAQYALMQTLTQQFRVNYPAAFLHAAAAAAATGYLPLSSSIMANTSTNAMKTSTNDDFRLRRKPTPESDDNNNHIRVSSSSSTSINDQPYRRETYQTLLESSQILRPPASQKLISMDPRRPYETSPIPSNPRYASSSSSGSPVGSPPCHSPPKSIASDPNNEFVCIPKKLMPVIAARIHDWLERNLNFVFSLSTIEENLVNDRDKLLLLSHLWHRLVLISMIENGFEIYVTKDLQINPTDLASTSASSSCTTNGTSSNPNLPTENDVKQIESLISRGKTLDIDEIGFNLIREVIIYKEGKTLLENPMADAFEKAECQAQARLTSWCGSRVKYSKIVFFICNIYQVKQDIFERLFCSNSMHQSTPIHTSFERFLSSTKSTNEL